MSHDNYRYHHNQPEITLFPESNTLDNSSIYSDIGFNGFDYGDCWQRPQISDGFSIYDSRTSDNRWGNRGSLSTRIGSDPAFPDWSTRCIPQESGCGIDITINTGPVFINLDNSGTGRFANGDDTYSSRFRKPWNNFEDFFSQRQRFPDFSSDYRYGGFDEGRLENVIRQAVLNSILNQAGHGESSYFGTPPYARRHNDFNSWNRYNGWSSSAERDPSLRLGLNLGNDNFIFGKINI